MRNHFSFSHLLALALSMAFLSCNTPKNITYFKGLDNESYTPVTAIQRLTIQPDDKLTILVSSKEPELAAVFNLVVAQGRVGSAGSTSGASQNQSEFTVSPEGTIHYPLLGDIELKGLTRTQAAKKIENIIFENNLLKDPVVTVEFTNATVTVLGDVNSPGDYAIDRDNMTVLQALGKAGDLAITGKRQNVLVLREDKDGEKSYRIDLTDPNSVMSSPAYYIQQNDVVYVEPNNTKKRQADANGNTFLTPSFWLSIASFLTTITVLIVK